MTDQNDIKTNQKESETVAAVKQTADQIQKKAGVVANDVQDQAIEITDEAKDQAKSAIETRKDMAARELSGVAEALRQTSSSLRGQDQPMFAQYGNRAADTLDRASSYLEEHNFDDLVSDTEDFARRQPELFIGGAFTLGLLAARFLKSSTPSYRSTMASGRANTNYDFAGETRYGTGYGSNMGRDNDDRYETLSNYDARRRDSS